MCTAAGTVEIFRVKVEISQLGYAQKNLYPTRWGYNNLYNPGKEFAHSKPLQNFNFAKFYLCNKVNCESTVNNQRCRVFHNSIALHIWL